jgi:transcriptional regulator with XRE-family HTH domain
MKNLEYDLDKTIIKIAEKIKSLRKEKGFTSYESFAFEHEINRVQYFRIEKGQNITLKTLIKVLQIHNLTLKEFFDDF